MDRVPVVTLCAQVTLQHEDIVVRFPQLTKVRWLQFRLQIQIDPVLDSPRNELLLDLAEDLQLLSVDVPLPRCWCHTGCAPSR